MLIGKYSSPHLVRYLIKSKSKDDFNCSSDHTDCMEQMFFICRAKEKVNLSDPLRINDHLILKKKISN